MELCRFIDPANVYVLTESRNGLPRCDHEAKGCPLRPTNRYEANARGRCLAIEVGTHFQADRGLIQFRYLMQISSPESEEVISGVRTSRHYRYAWLYPGAVHHRWATSTLIVRGTPKLPWSMPGPPRQYL